MKEWDRTKRKEKIAILGYRSGTTLVHKCLLLTGLVNWGLWSLTQFNSEPTAVKFELWFKYPKFNLEKILPKHYWEICKCPEMPFFIEEFTEKFPKSKFIVLDRDFKKRIDSHINIWGTGFWDNIAAKSQNLQKLIEDEFGYVPEGREFIVLYHAYIDRLQDEFLEKYPKELILRIDFNDLMKNWDTEMEKICDFIDIPYWRYKELFKIMRVMKHMDTTSDVKNYADSPTNT